MVSSVWLFSFVFYFIFFFHPEMPQSLINRLTKIASAPSAKTIHSMVPGAADELGPSTAGRRGGVSIVPVSSPAAPAAASRGKAAAPQQQPKTPKTKPVAAAQQNSRQGVKRPLPATPRSTY
jgi:hypothetical protein